MSEGLAKFFEWLPTDPHYETQEMERALLSETNPLRESTVFLEERAFKEGTQSSRSYRQPLTAQGVYNALKKPRFSELDDERDDARRLIYITDLDPHAIMALLNAKAIANTSNNKKSLTAIRCPEIDASIKGVPVSAFPDTGSCINTVSEEFAKRHNIKVDRARIRSVRLPKGNSIKTVGTTLAEFQFKGEETVYSLTFDVLKRSVWDVVLSKGFLILTKTMTEFRSRIHERLRPCVRSGDRLCLLGHAANDGIPCSVNGQPARAFPDTGSDLMLISGDFARRNNFRVHRGKKYRRFVEFADGSTAQTDGTVLDAKLEFDLPPVPPDTEFDYIDFLRNAETLLHCSTPRDQSTFVYDLHVMDNLLCDIILGSQFIFDNYLFDRLDQVPLTAETQLGSGNNIDAVSEEVCCFIREKTKPFFKRLRGHLLQTQSQRRLDPREGPQTWEDFRREEEDRRDHIDAHINTLPEPQKKIAREEESRRREQWQRNYPPPPLISPLNAPLEPP